jgi:hypothetical protein
LIKLVEASLVHRLAGKPVILSSPSTSSIGMNLGIRCSAFDLCRSFTGQGHGYDYKNQRDLMSMKYGGHV